ncbi:methylenetetrahydrofolate dehydrogenase (NADP+)/methenyltetrahydrofolate cyclohydrolase [Bradyrhizobium sp. USDA 4524]|uniref:bifunctional methylenetetrahydrofolate dehydrogenase/methenyltetrahydrofolate cyclohydrolase FolD n=1 Tax=unclassified Bradyrhizobium TaxID=2631580 RepID=UPI0020A01C1C|nr:MULTISPECIES: bifunctional methylenetetrahydrofolate dehydrogenase/methenyltetrahydrofolate cyclohydrolase FolD [unclassified Bradyrhizobium]MCP1845671.1 methylenetetrahydrofolate dehydrogenase (NADP+)/methenyltetrahydrofolate cyclohydrolase [Bradyrhizobium sp. USDA 4538]MCP1907005.1 methylenetetrahydrofolate dehydrogenase (NADP+)/methenyltetrahydrofolate cyclohydrolase [Bradyrhizobium sp. USDA 4537]MCP1985481.1 methylenetetrahydrofolate dehydrogenase (NADP+)/methenyltetrahydrofolate cyclohyd
MTAVNIDGKAIAEQERLKTAAGVADLQQRHGRVPGLAVVLVGNDPASEVYVASKARQTIATGMLPFEHRLPAKTSQEALLSLIRRLNADDEVDGILVQLPLPSHIDTDTVIRSVDPAKDVDGFHPENAGRLIRGLTSLVPCTPLGCMLLLRSVQTKLAGQHAVVVGRSNIVGKPITHLLLQADCTVTMTHSRSHDLPGLCRQADILVAAVGRPEMVRGSWIKPGAIIIDVGINRLPAEAGAKGRLVGDVAFGEAREVAGAITPVPGGVGPMTIACLLRNTLQAATKRWAEG